MCFLCMLNPPPTTGPYMCDVWSGTEPCTFSALDGASPHSISTGSIIGAPSESNMGLPAASICCCIGVPCASTATPWASLYSGNPLASNTCTMTGAPCEFRIGLPRPSTRMRIRGTKPAAAKVSITGLPSTNIGVPVASRFCRLACPCLFTSPCWQWKMGSPLLSSSASITGRPCASSTCLPASSSLARISACISGSVAGAPCASKSSDMGVKTGMPVSGSGLASSACPTAFIMPPWGT
mmetsp:Transcript_3279/g.7554  ORF Transcript_3279/g.7554 Transcript_3279/m.7554 type:complete len:239 (-) Transcript_3279:2008-2724(-)